MSNVIEIVHFVCYQIEYHQSCMSGGVINAINSLDIRSTDRIKIASGEREGIMNKRVRK